MTTRLLRTVTLLAALMTGGAALRADDAVREWSIQLHDFYTSQKGDRKVPITLYAKERAGKWVAGVASSRDAGRGSIGPARVYNTSWQYPDLSGAPIVDGKMKGRMVLHMTPDLWVPPDHKSFKLIFDLDAAVTDDGKLEGRYTVQKPQGVSDEAVETLHFRGGKVTGRVKPGKQPDFPAAFTLALKMQGSLIGGKPSYAGRCAILYLGIEDGKLVKASRGLLSFNMSEYARTDFPIDGSTVTVDGNTFKGVVRVPYRTLDLEPCDYVFDFNGSAFNNLLVGPYRVTVEREGKPNVVIEGSYDGKWEAGVTELSFADTFDLPWFVPVKGHTPPAPGEHPRLLFRKRDLPELRKRAATPEGQAILKRLRYLLDAARTATRSRPCSATPPMPT